MLTKVYVLLKDDGNVCCPSTEIVAVYEHEEEAHRVAKQHNDKAHKYPYTDVSHHVESYDVKRLR